MTSASTNLAQEYDVFISYSSRDRAMAEELAKRLREAGLSLFFDRWCLPGGKPWGPLLEQSIQESGSCAVLIGKEGFGPWQAREMWVALDRQGRDPDFPVIPTMLPGAEEVPSLFLELNTWVDMRRGLDDKAAFQMLLRSIRGEAVGESVFKELAEAVHPYLGLRAFREEDSAFFFGREAFAERLVGAVERAPFLAVVGPSGSGKSSVVQARLIPALRKGALAGSKAWEFAIFRPYKNPLWQLAASLVPMLEPEMDEIKRLAKIGELADYLREGRVSLGNTVERILEKQPGAERLVLVADQFEELFTYKESEPEREIFLSHLLEAAEEREGPLTVILTLRADFYSHCLGHRSLADRLEGRVVNIGPMTEEELRRAIEQPAGSVGVGFEAGLVERILADVRGEPGALPLLEFALTELWEKRRGGLLTHEIYEEFGGVGGAIAQRAEREYGRFSEEEKGLARRIFLNLVTPGEETEDVRRLAPLTEILPEEPTRADSVHRVVKTLADARLITTGREEASGEETVEVAHEALIRGWERLKGWVQEDRVFLEWQKGLRVDLGRWKESGELLRGKPLADALDWLEKRGENSSAEARRFIQTSLDWQEHERMVRERQRRRIFLGLVAGLTLALILTVAAGLGWRQSLRQRQIAVARQLVAQAELIRASRGGSWSVAGLLAAEALRRQPEATEPLAIADRVLGRLGRPLAQFDLNGEVWRAIFSTDGQRVATVKTEGTVQVWETATGKELTRLERGFMWPFVFFSPNGQWLATEDWASGKVQVWEVPTRKEIAQFKPTSPGEPPVASSPDSQLLAMGIASQVLVREFTTGNELAWLEHGSEVCSVVFSSDGKWLVTASWDGTARIWESATWKEIVRLDHGGGLTDVQLSPDARQVATISRNGFRLWDVSAALNSGATARQEIPDLLQDDLFSVVFSPDGRWLVPRSYNSNIARVWEVVTEKEVARLEHDDWVRAAAFSPDGRWLMTASEDGTARLWPIPVVLNAEAPTKSESVRLEHNSPLLSAVFGPEEGVVATASRDGMLRLWKTVTGKQSGWIGHDAGVWSVVFSPDGRWLATASADGMTTLYEVATGTEIARLQHAGPVLAVVFSPDGQRVATASADGTARLWVAPTEAQFDGVAGQEIVRLPHGGPVRSAAFSSDGRWLATASEDHMARVWDVSDALSPGRAASEEIARFEHDWEVWSLDFSPDGRRVATTSADHTARVWDVATGKEIARLQHSGFVFAVDFSPDGKTVATASADGTARVWEVVGGKEIAGLKYYDDWVRAVAFSPDGQRVALASGDTARVWERATGEVIAQLKHGWVVQSVCFSPDGTRLATTSLDGTARVWEVATRREITRLEHNGGVWSVVFSPDGQRMATASADGTARVWNVPETLLGTLCSHLPRNLTREEWQQYLGDEPYRKTCPNLP